MLNGFYGAMAASGDGDAPAFVTIDGTAPIEDVRDAILTRLETVDAVTA